MFVLVIIGFAIVIATLLTLVSEHRQMRAMLAKIWHALSDVDMPTGLEPIDLNVIDEYLAKTRQLHPSQRVELKLVKPVTAEPTDAMWLDAFAGSDILVRGNN